MTVHAEATAGDVGDVREYTLDHIDTLADADSVKVHVALASDRSQTATLDADVVGDPAERVVRADLGAAGGWLPTAPTVGRWLWETEVTFTDNRVLTWRGDSIVVNAQLD